jgi:hypothetical protein
MKAPRATKAYTSPVKVAREALAPENEQKVSGKVRATAMHIIRLSVMVVADLEDEEAPMHVFRWVAWASGAAAQRRRTDLVLHLRRTLERTRNGWPEERHLAAALAVWDRAVEQTRVRGLVAPRPEGVPVERYREAVAAARRPSPRDREEVPPPPPSAVVAVPPARRARVHREEPAAPEVAEKKPNAGADTKRAAVLQHLTTGLLEAVGAGDIEAARAANDAIAKLLTNG